MDLLRRDVRARGQRARLSALSLCFPIVPIVVLSFSSQKGMHHLGSCTSGLVLVSALWLDQWVRRRDRREVPLWVSHSAVVVAMLAPLAFIAAALGLPATPPQTTVACVIAGLLGLSLAVVAFRQGSRRLAMYVFTAGLMAVTVISRAPGGIDSDDLHFLDFPVWLRAELGQRAFGIHGHGDSDLGVFCWALEREMVPLSRPADVRDYLDADEPRFCVVREPAAQRLLRSDTPYFVFASGGNGKRVYTIVMNAAAHRARPAPRQPPPFSR